MTPFGREPWGDIFADRLWPEWSRDFGEEWRPSIDFFDRDNAYHLTAELPGINKEDIKIALDQGVLTISGKKESNKEEEKANYFVRESSYGAFSRSFRLPTEVEEDQVDARFKDGVLTVVMPHKKTPTQKAIEIN